MATLSGPFDIPQKPGNMIKVAMAAVKIWRGSAVAVIAGTGYATPLVPATDAHLFQGVALETVDNSAGSAGDKFINVQEAGTFRFTQSGIVQASVGKPVWFTDDNTISTTPGQVMAGRITAIDSDSTKAWCRIDEATRKAVPMAPVAITASGAIAPRTSATYVITKAGVAAMTLAAPTATTDDGIVIDILNSTANAHTITATGLLQTGSANVNVATFAAAVGGALRLVAFNAKWIAVSQIGITFS